MSLIKCPNCEETVSDKATTCPHCGFDLTAKKTKKQTKTKPKKESKQSVKKAEKAKGTDVKSAPIEKKAVLATESVSVPDTKKERKVYHFPVFLVIFNILVGLFLVVANVYYLIYLMNPGILPEWVRPKTEGLTEQQEPQEPQEPKDPKEPDDKKPGNGNKTYSKDGISFEYPEDWKIASDDYDNIYITKSIKNDTATVPYVMIHEYNKGDFDSAKSAIRAYYNEAPTLFAASNNYKVYSEMKTGAVGSRNFYQYAYTYLASSYSNRIIDYRYTVEVDGIIFMLSSTVEEDDAVQSNQIKLNDIVKQIIKTLKKGE